MGLFSPGSPVCTISCELSSSEDLPFLSSLESKALSYLACCVLFAIYSQVRWWEDWEGRRKTMRIPPLLLALSFKHLFHWHCHHFYYWHSYCWIAATMGLPWTGKEDENSKNSNNNNTTTKENLHTPSVLQGPNFLLLGPEREGFTKSSFCLHLAWTSRFGAIKALSIW